MDEAAVPLNYTPKTAIAEAVSFKVGWSFQGANYHPGQCDSKSWSISGTGKTNRKCISAT